MTGVDLSQLDGITVGEAHALLMQYSKEDMIVALATLETQNRDLVAEVDRLRRELKSRGLSHAADRSVAEQQREIRELSEQRRNLRGGAA